MSLRKLKSALHATKPADGLYESFAGRPEMGAEHEFVLFHLSRIKSLLGLATALVCEL